MRGPSLEQGRLARELLRLGSATLGECGARTMGPRIKAVWRGATLAAPCVPVACGPGDNLALHLAVAEAPPGSALVVLADDPPERGYWGEVLTTAAEARRLPGLVIDGGVRDVDALERHGFPVFATTVALRGASKSSGGSVGRPTVVGGAEVGAGDWVVADADGAVVVPRDALEEVTRSSRERAEKEQSYFKALEAGATTIELLQLDTAPVKRGPEG